MLILAYNEATNNPKILYALFRHIEKLLIFITVAEVHLIEVVAFNSKKDYKVIY